MNEFNNFGPGSYPPAFGTEMMMGPGAGPDLKGKWISKATGKEVNVRDAVMSDAGISVMLEDGRMIDMNTFSRDYFQVSDEVYDDKGNVIGHDRHVSVPHYDAGPDDYLHKPIKPRPGICPPPSDKLPGCGCEKPKPAPIPPMPIPPMPRPHKPACPPKYDSVAATKKRLDMITDVFSKVNPEPKIEGNVTLTVENFPKDQLQMLIDIFDVTVEDVALYIYKYYYTPEKIIAYLKEYLATEEEVKLTEKVNPTVDGNKSDEDTDFSQDGTGEDE